LGVGKKHIEGFQAISRVDLVALCDSNATHLNATAQAYNMPEAFCFTDYHRMFEQGNLDIVSIAVPNALHAEMTIAALDAGIHVLCEKPMAIRLEDAEAMRSAAERNQRELMIIYNRRSRSDVQWIRRAICDGRLGDIYHVNAYWRRETGIPAGWFADAPLSGGGPLIDLGVHILDIALWLQDFPSATTVSGQIYSGFGQRGLKKLNGSSAMEQFSVEDSAMAFIRLSNGGTISLQTSWAEHAQPREDRLRMEIMGTEGTAVLDIPNYTRDDTLRFYTEIEGEPVTVSPRIRWAPGYADHEDFIKLAVESILDHTEPPSNATQGVAAVRILQAIYESAHAGHEISFNSQ
jgi:predicted dehydrogenase